MSATTLIEDVHSGWFSKAVAAKIKVMTDNPVMPYTNIAWQVQGTQEYMMKAYAELIEDYIPELLAQVPLPEGFRYRSYTGQGEHGYIAAVILEWTPNFYKINCKYHMIHETLIHELSGIYAGTSPENALQGLHNWCSHAYTIVEAKIIEKLKKKQLRWYGLVRYTKNGVYGYHDSYKCYDMHNIFNRKKGA